MPDQEITRCDVCGGEIVEQDNVLSHADPAMDNVGPQGVHGPYRFDPVNLAAISDGAR